jgi:hypothetical protein
VNKKNPRVEIYTYYELPALNKSEYNYFANNCPISLNALNSKAFPSGSRKNIVACSPTSP